MRSSAEPHDSTAFFAKLWVRDARFHEYDEYVGSPHDTLPKGVSAERVAQRAHRYGMPLPRRDHSRAERDRVVDAHRATILLDPAMVGRIRAELAGRRLAGVSAGQRCTADYLAEIANCSEERLLQLVQRARRAHLHERNAAARRRG